MSSTDEDGPTSTRADRRVQDALDELHYRRAEFRRALQLQQVSTEIHLRFQQAVLDVHDELRPYREEVDDQWAEATPYEGGLEVLPGLVDRVETVTDVTVSGGVPTREERTEPVQIPERALLEISYDLDDIASALGFGSDTDTETPHEEPDLDDIRELARVRGQDGALESLPGGED